MDKPRLLLVDDDRLLLQSLSMFLRREGYEVFTCDRGEDVFAELERRGAEVLLVDVHVPGLGGWAGSDVGPAGGDGEGMGFLAEVRRRFPSVVTVVLTAYGTIESAVRATKLGAFEYLTKPVVDEEVRLVVEKAVRHQRLLWENRALRQQLDARYGMGQLLGHDPRMLKVFEVVAAAADSRVTVLMTGESGTGKSLLARAMHQRSSRRDGPFVEVSCGALPETLLESELFGHVKGAFTGAVADRPGRFQAADGGTLFLDEINSASPALQVKLLRVLQERQFEPVGSHETRTVDVRVVLASNVELAELVSAGRFRQDLYYRINVVHVRLPPLRERPGDIPLLASTFLRRFSREMRREVVGFTDAALTAMSRYPWPGNVRELENAVERAVLLGRRPLIDVADLPEAVAAGDGRGGRPAAASTDGTGNDEDELTAPMPLERALATAERKILRAALERNGWNRSATAVELGIDRTTLYKKMRKLGLGGGEAERMSA
ncbi:MAG: sigma-54-dependent transcriptional regulator [Tepidisphaerales bacterium]